MCVRASGHIALFIVAALITLLPLVTIFFFTNRKRQKGFVWLSVLGCFGFLALAVMKIQNKAAEFINSEVTYDFGLLLPVVAIILLFLAYAGIRKDGKARPFSRQAQVDPAFYTTDPEEYVSGNWYCSIYGILALVQGRKLHPLPQPEMVLSI